MIHSFLLIGQSNMAGRGFLGEAVDIDASRIRTLRNGRWQPFFRPINPDRAFSGVCLAESFAEKYSKKYDVDVGLICCADGGTTLHQWKPGSLLYDNAVNMAKLAERTSTIAGVLWHQGESDSKDEKEYSTYAERLIAMFGSLRNDLNLYDVPFVVGGIGDFVKDCVLYGDFSKYNYVNEALQVVAKEQSMVSFASAEGLTSNPDNIHFNSKSLYEFGLRYFDAFEKVRNPNKVFLEKPYDDERSFIESL